MSAWDMKATSFPHSFHHKISMLPKLPISNRKRGIRAARHSPEFIHLQSVSMLRISGFRSMWATSTSSYREKPTLHCRVWQENVLYLASKVRQINVYKISSAQLTQDSWESCKCKVTVVTVDKPFLKWKQIKSILSILANFMVCSWQASLKFQCHSKS